MHDVIIIGAGLAGLVAAENLHKAGKSVLVLEARDRLGGRLLNQDIGNGFTIDIGGQWIAPTQTRIIKLIERLGIKTYPTYNEGKNIFYWSGNKSTYEGLIPRFNPIALLDFAQAQARFDKMAKTVPLDAPWKAKQAKKWDSQTMETWIQRNMLTEAAKTFFRLYADAVFSADARDFSLLHALFYTHSGDNTDTLGSVANGAQERRIVGGTQSICTKLAEQLPDGSIQLNQALRSIIQTDSAIEIVTDDNRYSGQYVIVAIPPHLTAHISYEPLLPVKRMQLVQRVPAGSVIKCMAIYKSPFWRKVGLTGQVTSNEGPVRVTFDNSLPDDSRGILMGFFEGNDAREMSAKSQSERREAFLTCMVRYFGEEAAEPLDYIDRDWSAEAWTGGCYGAHFPAGVWSSYGEALREPCGRIHWAGADTGIKWNGYMDGAVESGERTADEVRSRLG